MADMSKYITEEKFISSVLVHNHERGDELQRHKSKIFADV
jgi:hypothetical protein